MDLILTLSGWHHTLSGDLKNYYFPLARHIFTPQTLIYPPGANLFFLLFPSESFATYELAFITANAILLFFLWRLLGSPRFFWLLVLAAGPIVFFRFDLLVVTFLALAMKFFQKENFPWSGFFLGAATATKIFPLILLPYFLLILWPKKKVLNFLPFFLLAIIILFAAFPYSIVSSFSFNFSKSVHLESVVGSILTIVTAVTNPGPHGVRFIDAVWILDPLYLLGHARIFRLLAPVGLSLTYVLLFFSRRTLRLSACALLVLVLIITSQVFSPQYVLWPAFLLLLLPIDRLNLFLVLLALVCTQIIYPLNYGELIDFFNLGKNSWLFGILAVRNLTLIILTVRLLKNEFLPLLPKKKSPTPV